MKASRKLVGTVVGAIATAAFVFYAARVFRGQSLQPFLGWSSLAGIGVAACFYSLLIPSTAVAWQALLRDSGERRSVRELAGILAVSQLAKYIPGNVGMHMGRAAMATTRGVPLAPVVLTMAVESFLAIAAAMLVGLTGILLSGHAIDSLEGNLRTALSTAGALIAGAGVLLLLLRRRVHAWLEKASLRFGGAHGDARLPRPATAAKAMSCYVLNYVAIGLGFWVMARLLLPDAMHSAALLGAAFALAWVGGFFTPGAPAGLGVREALLAALLGLSYSASDALVLVLAMRLATMLGDVLCFASGYALLRSLHPTLAARRHGT